MTGELDTSLSPSVRGRKRPQLPRSCSPGAGGGRPQMARSSSFKVPTSVSRPQLVRTASCRSATHASQRPQLESTTSYRSSPKTESPKGVAELEFPDSNGWAKVDLLADSDDDDSEEEDVDVSAHDLLAAARGRMEQQKLMDELREARQTIEQKDNEIKQLTGQLHMAISTKRDLVMANQDLEIQHEIDIHELSLKECDLKRSSFASLEMRAEVEKDFLNELTQLSAKVEQAEQRRIRDLRRKDEIIGLLREKLSRMDELIKLAQRVEESEERLVRECDEKDELIERLQDRVRRLEQVAQPEAATVQLCKISCERRLK